jgi:hypothetical protein
MAIVRPNKEAQIKVVSQVDTAVQCDEESYEKYIETLDERHLDLSGEPTRFVLKKYLSWGEQDQVDDLKTKIEGKKVKVQMSFMAEDVRLALVDIENPNDVPELNQLRIEKDKWGKATKEFVGLLRDIKVVNDLYNARASSHKSDGDLKKS